METLLKSHTVKEIKSPAPVFFTTADSFTTAFQSLVKNKILSAPLLDLKSNSFIGFLDIRDVISMTLIVFEKCMSHSAGQTVESLDQLLARVWSNLQQENNAISLEYLARRNPFISVDENATLFELAQVLTNLRATRVRRIAVLNSEKKLAAVISQSSLLQFVASRLNIVSPTADKDHLPELAHTVKSANVGTYPCYTIPETAPAYSAFKVLDTKNVGGIAIVDTAGHIVGNLSAKDLKNFILNPKLSELNVPVREFLRRLRDEQINEMTPVLHCYPTSTLREVVFKMVGSRVHRLYIVNDAQSFAPIGVVSLSDVMKALFGEAIKQK